MQRSTVKGENEYKARHAATADPGQSVPRAKYDALQAKYDALYGGHASQTEQFNEAIGIIQALMNRLAYYENENAPSSSKSLENERVKNEGKSPKTRPQTPAKNPPESPEDSPGIRAHPESTPRRRSWSTSSLTTSPRTVTAAVPPPLTKSR